MGSRLVRQFTNGYLEIQAAHFRDNNASKALCIVGIHLVRRFPCSQKPCVSFCQCGQENRTCISATLFPTLSQRNCSFECGISIKAAFYMIFLFPLPAFWIFWMAVLRQLDCVFSDSNAFEWVSFVRSTICHCEIYISFFSTFVGFFIQKYHHILNY